MARNQIDKYLNQLEIRKGNYLKKQHKEYRLPRLQKSLEALKSVSNHHTIPTEIITEIETIFRLMPVHELYFIKVNQEEFDEYIKKINDLYIRIEDDYEAYFEKKSINHWGNLSFLVYVVFFFHESIEKRLGNYALPSLALIIVGFMIYQNRTHLLDKLPKFN